jgi:hypothetical protein
MIPYDLKSSSSKFALGCPKAHLYQTNPTPEKPTDPTSRKTHPIILSKDPRQHQHYAERLQKNLPPEGFFASGSLVRVVQ